MTVKATSVLCITNIKAKKSACVYRHITPTQARDYSVFTARLAVKFSDRSPHTGYARLIPLSF